MKQVSTIAHEKATRRWLFHAAASSAQRHSDGAYLAGMVPVVATKPRAVAVVLVVDAQAQSIAPVAPALSAATAMVAVRARWTPGVMVRGGPGYSQPLRRK